MQTFKYEEIALADLASPELKQEAEAQAGAKAYRIQIFGDGGVAEPEPAECLELEGKVGFAWGDVYWATSGGNVYEDINIWLNDEEEWEGREIY
jgi:hypothetical protein